MGRLVCKHILCQRDTFTLSVPELVMGVGEKIALLGENGCGKTTLLQVLTGLLPLSGGRIEFKGTRWDRLTAAKRAEHMAYLPQEAQVLFNLTVEELLGLTIDKRRILKGNDREQAVMATEMGAFLKRIYHSLSGGEKRRAMLLRILCQNRAFTLLDEPTAPLDMRHGLKIMGFLQAMPSTVVVAMHDINLATRFFTRFLLMKNGRIIFDVSKTELETEMLENIYGLQLDVCNGYFLPAA